MNNHNDQINILVMNQINSHRALYDRHLNEITNTE